MVSILDIGFVFSRGGAAAAQDNTQPASGQSQRGITIAASKYSSEDAATLVQYTIALINYRFPVLYCSC
jgi:hypothetical protein